MNQTIVSIILPIGENALFTTECVDRVINQSSGDYELICLHNGSNSEAFEYITKLSNNDRRVKLIVCDEPGSTENVNSAIEKSKGRYIYFIDPNDIISENFVAQCSRIMDKDSSDVAVFSVKKTNQDTGETEEVLRAAVPDSFPERTGVDAESMDYDLLNSYTTCISNKIFRKDFLTQRELDYRFPLSFAVLALAESKSVSVLSDVFVIHRVAKQLSAQNKISVEELYDNLTSLKKSLIERGLFERYESSFNRSVLDVIVNYYENISLYQDVKKFEKYAAEKHSELFGTKDNNFCVVSKLNLKYQNILRLADRDINISENPVLSVVIPMYNASAYMHSTLRSILDQNLDEIEVICVDDGSTDDSREIVQEIMKMDPRVSLVCQNNSYAGAARNNGLSRARGKYIHFMDADDMVTGYGYLCAVQKMNKYDLDVLKFRNIARDELIQDTVSRPLYTFDQFREGDYNRLLDPEKDQILMRCNVTPWSGIYKRSFLVDKKISFNSLYCCNDRSFFNHVIITADRIMISMDYVVIHRVSVSGSLIDTRAAHFDCNCESVRIIEKILLDNEVSQTLFTSIMKREFDDLLLWNRRLSRDEVNGNQVLEATETILSEYVDKYDFVYQYYKKYRSDKDKLEEERSREDEENEEIEDVPVTPVITEKKQTFYYDYVDHPKVSVVVPIYNQEEYLNLALDSLTKQNLKDIEFVCVNDGSTDFSMDILKQYCEMDGRIVIIDKPNSGYGNTMNIGLNESRGDYIGILEPDDYVPRNMYSELYNIAVNNELDFVKANFNRFWVNDDGSMKKKLFRLSSDTSYYNRLINPGEETETFQFVMNTWSGIYKRSFLDENNIRHNETPGASYQDNGFWFQTFIRAERAWFVNKAYYMNRRDNPNSSMFSKGKFDAVTNEYNFIWKILSSEPMLLEKYEKIFYLKKFSNSMVTYYRLATNLKVEYLNHIREEFKTPLEEGKLDPELFDDLLWKQVNEIVSDPVAYYNKIRVSVIIPAYNAERYISDCLDSLLVRDEIHSEIIVVDDGSTDNTLNILREYEAKDSRVKVYTQENSGAGAARNNGMKYATGEYLAFLDADDFFDPEMLRISYNRAMIEDADVVVFRSQDYFERTRTYAGMSYTIKTSLLPAEMPFAGTDIERNIFGVFVGWPWDKLFKAEFVRNNQLKFQEQRTTNDMLFVFSAIVKAERIITIDNVFANHRRLDDGESLSVSRELSWDCFYFALKELKKQLSEWELYERFERDFINYALHFSLWQLNTIKGDSYFKLYNKLRDEWFSEFGIADHNRFYFYDLDEYDQYLDIVENTAEDYLFVKKDRLTQVISDQNKENSRLNKLVKTDKTKISSLEKRLKESGKLLNEEKVKTESEKKKNDALRRSKTYKIGRMATWLPRKVRRIIKG